MPLWQKFAVGILEVLRRLRIQNNDGRATCLFARSKDDMKGIAPNTRYQRLAVGGHALRGLDARPNPRRSRCGPPGRPRD